MGMTKRDVAARFLILRGQRTLRQFSEDTGVSHSTLQRCETGAGSPSVEVLIKLSEQDRVNLDWLIMGRGTKRRKA